MPIVTTDLQFRLSGGAANTSPAASLGGAESTAGGGVITDNVANNVWDDVSGAESAAGDIEYRGIYVHNNHGTLPLQSSVVWFDTAGGDETTAAGTDAAMAMAAEAINVTMATIADESTAPATVSFTTPVTKGTGLSTGGDVPAGGRKGLWLRRNVTAGASAASDQMSVRWEGETGP